MASTSIKSSAQSLLSSAGLYHRVKASFIYRFYWTLFDRKAIELIDQEFAFYEKNLCGFKQGDLIFDIGANHGHKSSLFLRLGAKVLAVDPDPTNTNILRQKYHFLRLIKRPITILQKAVSENNGTQTMWVEKAGSAKNTLSTKWVATLEKGADRFGEAITFGSTRTVETVSLDELVRQFGRPFYIKIDVEGHEASVLGGLSSPVPYLSFEVNLPEFLPEALKCIKMLETVHPSAVFNYIIDCPNGFLLPSWLKADQFAEEVSKCNAPSIEVFWKSAN